MPEDIVTKINNLYKTKKISKKYLDILLDFFYSYSKATKNYISTNELNILFNTLLDLLIKQFTNPFLFSPYHKKITSPFDYEKFGIDFLRPLVDIKNSKVFGSNNLKKIEDYIEKKDNVILLANHQTEVDPILIYILLEKNFPIIASNIIYVAGDRVITDPIAVPFSMGCNLLCIYSKKYIDLDINLKYQKQMHNKKVMSLMSLILSEGGKIIYVAPSGGRDRKNKSGKIQINPFDPQSLEMFYLMCKRSKKLTHFFPLCLDTYDILPPPKKTQIEMGEKRKPNRSSIFISFKDELDMENFPGKNEKNKIKRRANRAKYIHNIVKEEYKKRKIK